MTGARFKSFVILAEMRTGSNLLEASLNDLPGVKCLGEAFNPTFIGGPKRTELCGVTLAERNADPHLLLRRMDERRDALTGFRYFHDHDPRLFDAILAGPARAKIVLTRNPLDSYLSLRIASETGQWMLRKVTDRYVTPKVRFDAAEFDAYLGRLQAQQLRILRALQTTGQSAFWIGYDDLNDVAVLNGLAAWLGVAGRLAAPSDALTRQNPEAPADKVANPDEMAAALARFDRFDLWRTPNFEPRRGPSLPTWVAAPRSGLLHLPVPGGPLAQVEGWLAALDGTGRDRLVRDLTRRTFRDWRRTHPGARVFTVVRHPAERAHEVFAQRILPVGPDTFQRLRDSLRTQHGVPLPEGSPGPAWTRRDHRAAFLGFLAFVRANLAGQTPHRVDALWASQEEVIQGFAQVALPDLILRSDRLAEGLAQAAAQVGRPSAPPPPPPAPDPSPVPLSQVHDAEVEATARAAYARDYAAFGFAEWRAPAA